MTDKQIIIDGVDVSGCHNKTFYKNDEGDVQCKCYRFEDVDSDTLLFGICKQHPHCYYKQLKAKEQECEELKIYIESNEQQVKEVETLVMDNDRLINELDQLKAENDKYSLFIEKLCDYAGLECDSEEQAMRTLSDLASQMNKARWIIDRYKQTLTEIKEIAEKRNYLDYNECLDDILQKISECEGNDE